MARISDEARALVGPHVDEIAAGSSEDEREPVTFRPVVLRAAKEMKPPERRAFLRARGWKTIDRDSWVAPYDTPGYSCYSLAAAIRVALEREIPQV